MSFETFRRAVGKQIERLQKHDMYRVDVERDTVWEAYLAAFPDGTNPIYRERSVHDCSTCRGFIKNIGNAVAIIDGKMESVWDFEFDDDSEGYATVRAALSALVHGAKITDKFLHFESRVGADKTFEDLLATAQRKGMGLAKDAPTTKEWTHFFANLKPQFVAQNADIPALLAKPRDAHQVLGRGLRELTLTAFDEVLDLMADGSLYRGDEFKAAVVAFRKLKVQFDKIEGEREQDIFVWEQVPKIGSLALFRNSAIGTLLVDLSKGDDLETAAKAFESKVAPQNYKRTKALVTPKMIAAAKQEVEALGLTSALQRRYAVLSDITINDILFADRAAKKTITGDVFDDLAESVTKIDTKALERIEEVPIERFLSDVLPRAQSIEVLLENRHAGNLVSLIAPQDPTAGQLFKWDNNFSWAYNGNVTDAIKERVKAAGGAVDGDLCCRLAWDYSDDLDFHMIEPNGYRIFFSNRRRRSFNGGVLDLDANGADGIQSAPAENIVYADRNGMMEGEYRLVVNNYNRRSDGAGFEVEIEFDGQRHNFVYEKAMRRGEYVDVATVHYSKRDGFKVVGAFKSTQASRTMWGLQTQQWHRAKVVMLSPNYWEDAKAVGNKHYMFMLDGCVNDEPPRGFFNEFLRESLTPHRKVLDLLGGKLRVEDDPNQLSGLGFSSTQRNSVVLRVKGATTRTIRVMV